jgi:hypothetical protein
MFASLNLSKKLSEMGCVSESKMTWLDDRHPLDKSVRIPGVRKYSLSYNYYCTEPPQAFHPWDFIANTEQARKNAEILWGREIELGCPCCGYIGYYENEEWDYRRHQAIDAPDFWQFVNESIEGRG